nr:HAMP domain-containing sensor histidine kinase [Clostridium yunnanense]
MATNGIITYFVSKSIVKPLKELDRGAGEILKGNLNYKLNIDSTDEIGEVAETFEEMRLRLKKSLEIQNQYEENRKELIASISHDLKTPITSIKGYIEGIKDGVADTPDKMEKYVNTILTKANYMDSLINDLFLYSKLELNKEPFKFQTVDMNIYIQDCVEEINFDLDQSKVELIADVPEKPTLIDIDVQKVKRAIMNIVENSIKYKTDGKLIINIIVKSNNDLLTVEIRDNGKGIPKEALPYIFERFYRADTSRETVIGGSGLGLAIAKKIMDEHNGRIAVLSELGKGTSIFLSFKK